MNAQLLFTHPTITAVAAGHPGTTAAQVILHWAIQRGLAVIPKADAEVMLCENLASANAGLVLSDEEMAKISGMDLGLRFNDPADVSSHLALYLTTR